MQYNSHDAFLTVPTFSKNPSINDKKSNLTVKDKIYQLFKTFPNKQICMQAVYNLGLPNYFIDIDYIQSQIESKKSDIQLNSLYSVLNCIKKEISKINRNTEVQQPIAKTQKMIVLPINRVKTSFPIKHRQLSSDQIIKRALEQELSIRKKLKNKQQKQINYQKNKNQHLEKRLQKIKSMNKRVQEVCQKQKKKQKILTQGNSLSPLKDSTQQFFIRERNLNIRTCSNSHFMKKQLESERQKEYNDFYNAMCAKEQIMKSRYENQKHKKLMSLVEKTNEKQNKIQQVKLRKQERNKELFYSKLKNMIEKQQKIQYIRQSQAKIMGQNISETCKNSFKTMNNFQNTGNSMTMTNFGQSSPFFNSKIDNYQKSITQEKQILQKIQEKSKKKNQLIKMRVQKLKKCRQQEQLRREWHKMNKQKQLQDKINSSPTNGKSDSKITLIRQPSNNKNQKSQQKYIKERSQKIKINQNTFEDIIQLRKLPDHELQKKLFEHKQRDIRTLFSKKLLEFLK